MKGEKNLLLIVLLTLALSSCGVNDPNNDMYDNSAEENGVVVQTENGTVSLPGKIKIINNTYQTIYLPFIANHDCYFSCYSLEQKVGSNWISLSFNENENKWEKSIAKDSIWVICTASKDPVRINPLQEFEIQISKVENAGEYRIVVFYRNSEFYSENNTDKKISVNYLVKQ